jgi:hypothetical protein
MWSVVNDPFVEYAVVEDQEGFEQQHAWVEGRLAAFPFVLLQHAF